VPFLGRIWNRLRGKKDDPTFGTQIAIVGGAAAVAESQTDDATPDYGWSGEHLSGSDYGGGGGFDGGGGGDSGGGGF
jgi:uncharacterized membrane protein YgcG